MFGSTNIRSTSLWVNKYSVDEFTGRQIFVSTCILIISGEVLRDKTAYAAQVWNGKKSRWCDPCACQGCQIFLATAYQNGENKPKNHTIYQWNPTIEVLSDNKMCQMNGTMANCLATKCLATKCLATKSLLLWKWQNVSRQNASLQKCLLPKCHTTNCLLWQNVSRFKNVSYFKMLPDWKTTIYNCRKM
jgi:hypothetical protein